MFLSRRRARNGSARRSRQAPVGDFERHVVVGSHVLLEQLVLSPLLRLAKIQSELENSQEAQGRRDSAIDRFLHLER